MKTRLLIVIGSVMTVVALLAVGCMQAEASEPETTVLEPEDALETALTWLRETYPDMAPQSGTTWTVEDVAVRGANGEPLLGAAQKRMVSDDWTALVSWAVVAPDFLSYRIELQSTTLGWYWEGTVKAVGGAVAEEIEMQEMTEDLAADVARKFVAASPTFVSSGMDETLTLVQARVAAVPFGWEFVFAFDSRHSGYGNTSEQVTLPVITPRSVVVAVEKMEVVEAVMDGKWDMMSQGFIPMNEDAARDMAEGFVRNSPTFAFDGIPATLAVAETLYPDIENAWTFVFQFESAHAGYGDRTGRMLAEVITPHEAHITVENGEVVSALMDGQWDMLSQDMVS